MWMSDPDGVRTQGESVYPALHRALRPVAKEVVAASAKV